MPNWLPNSTRQRHRYGTKPTILKFGGGPNPDRSIGINIHHDVASVCLKDGATYDTITSAFAMLMGGLPRSVRSRRLPAKHTPYPTQ
jgi:hypothetical protein